MPLSMTLELVQKNSSSRSTLIIQMNLQNDERGTGCLVAREVAKILLDFLKSGKHGGRRTGMAPHAPKGARSQR